MYISPHKFSPFFAPPLHWVIVTRGRKPKNKRAMGSGAKRMWRNFASHLNKRLELDMVRRKKGVQMHFVTFLQLFALGLKSFHYVLFATVCHFSPLFAPSRRGVWPTILAEWPKRDVAAWGSKPKIYGMDWAGEKPKCGAWFFAQLWYPVNTICKRSSRAQSRI